MILNGELNKLTKRKLIQLLEFVDNSLKFQSDEPFSNLTNRVKSFIPHESTICGYGEVENRSLSKIKHLENISYPKEWVEIYHEKKFHLIDPILLTHISTFKPQKWSQTYQSFPNIDLKFVSVAQEFNLFEGLTHGVFEPEDSTATIFSFATPSLEPSDHQIKCLHIITPYLHQALLRLCRKQKLLQKLDVRMPLSQREVEVLNWIKVGKTNWEISVIMKISENTVKYHATNILKKLNASNRGHALAKALELEIISL